MSKRKNPPQMTLQRYVLTGAAIGLYFGMFFRPSRQPSVFVAIGLAALIAMALAVLSLFRGPRPTFSELLRQIAVNFVRYSLILLVFEARHLAYNFGGRLATAVLTTAAGGLFGLWYGYEQRSKTPETTEQRQQGANSQ